MRRIMPSEMVPAQQLADVEDDLVRLAAAKDAEIATLTEQRDEARAAEADITKGFETVERECREWHRRCNALTEQRDRAMEVCADAYQVVGALSHLTGTFDHPDVQRALDNLAEPEAPPHSDLLPWPKEDGLDQAMRAVEAARAYRDAETDGTPRMYRGKALQNLADALDAALARIAR